MNVLGIDGGGTKTVCVLMDEAGQIWGRGQAGPSNYQTVGIEAAKTAIDTAITQAILNSGRENITIDGIGLGLAGVGRPEDVRVVQDWLQPIQSKFQPDAVVIESDSVIALAGGVGQGEGIVVIAGTGSQVFGKNSQGQTKRVGGWGYLLGDEGSGYHIAIQGLQAALKSYDGRIASTRLVEALQHHLGLETIEGLIEVVYRRGWAAKEIAALAPIIDQVAASGDQVATDIISAATAELVLATEVAIASLFEPQASFKIVTMGGVWQGMTHLRYQFIEEIYAIAPAAEVIWPRYEPAFGAGLLGLQALGMTPNLFDF